MTYLYLFLQSNLLEWPVYLWAIDSARSRANLPSWSLARRAIAVTVINSITHPVVFFLIMNLSLPYLANILLAESFAVGVEAWLLTSYLRFRWPQALLASLLANLISWQIAPMLTYSLFQP